MAPLNMEDYMGGAPGAEHLCVLVHGLWGNPKHMASLARALRAQFPPEQVHILVAKRNSGSFTYDGIELGGERVCTEIEEKLELIRSRGERITKLSVVGYSLGGLVARYAIGLLLARGVLDDLECMNFTAFASPFLGVRTPLRGWANHMWNVLGARTLCMSGRQLFGIDRFRDTGKPLLAVLADPNSIFMRALARFRRRTLYANIVNDRSAVYYTTAISATDPYATLFAADSNHVANRVRYLPGYEPIILDPEEPILPPPEQPPENEASPFTMRLSRWAKRVPFVLVLTLLVPVGVVTFLVNSAIQTIRSHRRVKLHESGRAGINVEDYRVNLWFKEMRSAVEGAYEELNSAQENEFLDEGGGTVTPSKGDESLLDADRKQQRENDSEVNPETRPLLSRESTAGGDNLYQTLALAPYQFDAIRALDKLGWRKYPVWIHKHRHSHAAIIVRIEKPAFDEGKVVLKHWVTEEFLT